MTSIPLAQLRIVHAVTVNGRAHNHFCVAPIVGSPSQLLCVALRLASHPVPHVVITYAADKPPVCADLTGASWLPLLPA